MEKYNKKARKVDKVLAETPRYPLLTLVMEGIMDGENSKGRQMLEYVKQIIEVVGRHKYSEMKRLAQDRKNWSTASNQSGD